MPQAFICSYLRTAIGRFGGALSHTRTDDLGAIPIKALMEREKSIDWVEVDEVIFGCANQAGEDNRNVARMSALLAGLPESVPGTTLNRLCGSGMDAVVTAARAIMAGEANLIIAGGVESMSRAPFVMPKAETAFSRSNEIHDTTIGWRFINPVMAERYGVDSMPQTAENVAEDRQISRADQDAFALHSQEKAARARDSLAQEIIPVTIPQRRGDPIIFQRDEHPRLTSLDKLAALKAPFRDGGTVTAGNASGVNDGAAVIVVASEEAIKRHGLIPVARIVGGATAGIAPRLMGLGPIPALSKLFERLDMTQDRFDVIELNEAFAAQALACLRAYNIADDDPRVNRYGGAIALGHPLGMSGVRITGTAARQLARTGGQYALASMCVGVGQGIAVALERV